MRNIDKTKVAIQKASRRIDNDLSASTARLNIRGPTQPTATVPIGPVTHSVKLPAIKLVLYIGNKIFYILGFTRLMLHGRYILIWLSVQL